MYLGRQRDFSGNCNIMLFSIGDIGIGREVPVVIEKQMKLNSSFGPTKLSPGKKSQTKRNGGTIQRKQRVLKPKFMIHWSCHPADVQSVIK